MRQDFHIIMLHTDMFECRNAYSKQNQKVTCNNKTPWMKSQFQTEQQINWLTISTVIKSMIVSSFFSKCMKAHVWGRNISINLIGTYFHSNNNR